MVRSSRMAVVAALIGAGFRRAGVSGAIEQRAIDLVLLGVIPVIALAVVDRRCLIYGSRF